MLARPGPVQGGPLARIPGLRGIAGGFAAFGARVAALGAALAFAGWGFVVLGSCSLDYDPARLEQEMAGDVPETVLMDFRHTIVSGAQVWVVLEAGRAETYGKRSEIVLEGVHFREYDAAGELVAEALADRAVFHTDSEDASARGSIRIYSPDQEASLHAESLTWTREGRRLRADPAARVRVEKDDGSYAEGQGFTADFRRRRVEFDGSVEGRYVWDEDE